MLAVPHAGSGERQLDRLLGSGHGHIEQSPLLLYVIFGSHGSAGREYVLFHTGHIYIREFQTLGRMDSHEGYPVGGVLPFLHVHCTEK